jgi:hypothetical protein
LTDRYIIDKVWCDEAAEIAIVITPPFWATVYAYVFYAGLSVAVLFFLFICLQKRKKKNSPNGKHSNAKNKNKKKN